MTSPVVLGCFKGLQKENKATHVTRRAAPMTKPMLKTLYAFLDRSNDTSKSFTLWFKVVTSLSWYACVRMSEALYAIGEFFGVRMQDIVNTKYEEIVTAHEAVMMLYRRVDAITSVELAVTLSKKKVGALTAGDVEVVACIGDFASHVLES
ncbi:hypothetical protein DYB30_012350 [Aphanomyces astaci]|uniref:Uncharacterized protein n=1 Tax=Aphanomyces astaci TaxID=112090 RepID=A0A397DTP2_APHAT|nr:hypothetical protein DYB30_012350 [Aphanomyces astaci]